MQSVSVAIQTIRMQLLQSQRVAEAIQEGMVLLHLLRSAAEVSPESSTSVVQSRLLALSGSGHSSSV